MLYLSGVLDFNCDLNSFSQMLYVFINISTDYVFTSIMAYIISSLSPFMLNTAFHFLWTLSINYLLMHLDCLVATHSRRYKGKEIIKVIGGQRGGGGHVL